MSIFELNIIVYNRFGVILSSDGPGKNFEPSYLFLVRAMSCFH